MTNTKHILIIAYLVSLWCTSIAPSAAQTLDSAKADVVEKARGNWYWAHGTLSAVYPGFPFWQIALSSALKNDEVFTLRLNSSFIPQNIDLAFGAEVSRRTEISLLYGITHRENCSFFSLSGGFAYQNGVKVVDENGHVTAIGQLPVYYSTLGLVMEAHAALKAFGIGLGVAVIGNLNLYHSYIGLGLTAHLGWMP